jgi:class 3 adenylate cyclase/tetratricopeptide (TPR) repeat protein
VAALETATILFSDVAASTELRTALGDDRADEVRRQHDAVIRAVLAQRDGHEVKHTGDGLMVAFSSAANAVSAAIEMQRGVARLAAELGTPLSIRIGLSAGDVERDGNDLFGLPVVQAARLCAEARPGQILVSDIARALAGSRGNIEFSSLGPRELKGLDTPLVVHEVPWAESAPAIVFPNAFVTTRPTALIGRDVELARVRETWARVAAGERRVVLLGGEPGVGKTRLITEVARSVYDDGGVVVLGRCDDAVPAPLRPVIEIVRHVLEHASEDVLGNLPESSRRILSGLARGEIEHGDGDPLARVHALHEAVDELLVALARTAPTLVVIDDLHWADPATVLLLRHIAGSMSASRSMVVGTYRDTDLDRTHAFAAALADLRRLATTERISLSGLDRAATTDLVAAWAGSAAPEAFVAAVFAETEGNPFFVEEVLRHLAESGAIRRGSDGEWRAERSLDQLGIPEGIRETVGRRLARLGEQANVLLSVAAVAGREFDADVVVRASGISETHTIEALQRAVRSGLVIEGDRFGAFMFAHALVRATLLDEMVTLRRVRLHQAIAESIEALRDGSLTEHVDALAYHYGEAAVAGCWEQAIYYHRLAADRAEAIGDPNGLESHLKAALEIQDAFGDPSASDEYELVHRLAWAMSNSLDPAAAHHYVDRAMRIAMDLGDTVLMARAITPLGNLFEYAGANAELVTRAESIRNMLPPGDSAARAIVGGLLASVRSVSLVTRDDWETNQRDADAAYAMAERTGSDGARGFTSIAVHNTLWGRWQPERSLAAARRIFELTRDPDDPVPRFEIGAAAGLVEFRWVASGQLRQMSSHLQLADRAAYERTLDIGESSASARLFRWVAGYLSLTRGTLALADGRLDETRAATERALELAPTVPNVMLGYHAQRWARRLETDTVDSELLEKIAPTVPFPHIEGLCALVRAERGHHDTAARILDDFAARPGSGVPWNSGQSATLRVLAETCAHIGHADLAAAIHPIVNLYEGQLFAAFNCVFTDGAADRALGQLAFALGNYDNAIERFHAAIGLETKFAAPALEARSRYWLARALLARNGNLDPQRARDELDRAAAIADERGLTGISRLIESIA